MLVEERGLKSMVARNPGPFTLDGTKSYVIGDDHVAVVDPGPADERHVRALAALLEGCGSVRLLLTHAHEDHADGAPMLARLSGAAILGAGPVGQRLEDGALVETDVGALRVISTPGHARPHLAYLWEERQALFAGDLILGRGETTWVGGYPGCVRDYLASLERVRGLELRRLYPAHGPPIDDVAARIDRFAGHRRDRIRQVDAALRERPGTSLAELMERVYGAVPEELHGAATASLAALVEHVRADEVVPGKPEGRAPLSERNQA